MKQQDKKRIVLTGATGLIGYGLYRRLNDIYRITVLTRNPLSAKQRLPDAERHLLWAPGVSGEWQSALDGSHAVIHLAAESLFSGRWTDKLKRRIRESRMQGTNEIADAILACENPPPIFICSSAIGYYGDTGDTIVTEHSPPGTDFLASVCVEWEKAAQRAHSTRTRVVNIRTGPVLAKHGGALGKLLPVFKWGLGAWFGNGRQWFPWIHIDDVTGIIARAIESSDMEGAYNVTAPVVVTNKGFSKILGQVLRRPVLFGVPGWVLRSGLGEFSSSLLTGQRAEPQRTLECGYVYNYPELTDAFHELLE